MRTGAMPHVREADGVEPDVEEESSEEESEEDEPARPSIPAIRPPGDEVSCSFTLTIRTPSILCSMRDELECFLAMSRTL
jgi:hypothetical protein